MSPSDFDNLFAPPAPSPAKAPPNTTVGRVPLRYYQLEDAAAVMHAVETGHRRVSAVGATGCGKSLLEAESSAGCSARRKRSWCCLTKPCSSIRPPTRSNGTLTSKSAGWRLSRPSAP